MTSIQLFLCLGAALWMIGLHGLLIRRHPLRRIIAINVMSSGVFLIMVALARRSDPADPVMHALVVTGLVVAVSATAFALRLAGSRPTERARSREQQ
jgi:multicomponent Na+:H+ antiporter subunit C